jgi:hypothetical protein
MKLVFKFLIITITILDKISDFFRKKSCLFLKIILNFLGILFNKNIKKIISHFMMEKLEIFYMTELKLR